jgi:hypothetical protein
VGCVERGVAVYRGPERGLLVEEAVLDVGGATVCGGVGDDVEEAVEGVAAVIVLVLLLVVV